MMGKNFRTKSLLLIHNIHDLRSERFLGFAHGLVSDLGYLFTPRPANTPRSVYDLA